MPDNVDCPIYLVIDRNPNQGHLVTLGMLAVDLQGSTKKYIQVMTNGENELSIISEFADHLTQVLTEISDWNHNNPEKQKSTHIFVYESSEVNDLKNSLANHAQRGVLLKEMGLPSTPEGGRGGGNL